MFNKLLLILILVTFSQSRDLIVGNEGGRKIYDQNLEATPAIWKQERNITVNAANNEVIGQVKVTDLRGEKDGDVKIVEGGEGQKNVTIELKSPTVFRGFDFHVEVYAVSNDGNPGIPRNVAEESASDDMKQPKTNTDDFSTTPIPTDIAKGSTNSGSLIPEASNQPLANAATTNSPVRNGRDTVKTESSRTPSVPQIIMNSGFTVSEITKDTLINEEVRPSPVNNDENKDNASDSKYYSDPNLKEDSTTKSPIRNSRDVAKLSSTTQSPTNQEDRDINVPLATKDFEFNDRKSQHSHETSDKSIKANDSNAPLPVSSITKDGLPKSLNRVSRDTESEDSKASRDVSTTDLPIAKANNENDTAIDSNVSDKDSRITRDTEQQENSGNTTVTNQKFATNRLPTAHNENSNADNNNRFGNVRMNSQIDGSTLKPYFIPMSVGTDDLPTSTTEKPTNERQDQNGSSQFRRGRQTPENENPVTSTTVNPQAKELSTSEGQPMSFKFQPHTLLTVERTKQDTFSKSNEKV